MSAFDRAIVRECTHFAMGKYSPLPTKITHMGNDFALFPRLCKPVPIFATGFRKMGLPKLLCGAGFWKTTLSNKT
jgi:hypothetical protein